MAGLLYTTGDKPTDRHSVVPSQDNSVFITGRGGKVSGERTLPVPVQNNIDVENIRFSDSEVNNATETKHGLLRKLSGEEDEFLNGAGEFVKPPRSGSGFGNIWWVQSGQTVTVGEAYENVVTFLRIDGRLVINGIQTIL